MSRLVLAAAFLLACSSPPPAEVDGDPGRPVDVIRPDAGDVLADASNPDAGTTSDAGELLSDAGELGAVDAGDAGDEPGDDAGEVVANRMADFRLPDVNTHSATHGTRVSPRDHLGRVTGWYFATAT
jgi:hypothetical protein